MPHVTYIRLFERPDNGLAASGSEMRAMGPARKGGVTDGQYAEKTLRLGR